MFAIMATPKFQFNGASRLGAFMNYMRFAFSMLTAYWHAGSRRSRQFYTRLYEKAVVGLLLGAYGSGAVAAFTTIDETRGPFLDVICPVSNWMAAVVVPLATIAFIVAAIAFFWGEEIAGMTKKWITIIIAVCMALAGSAVVSWIGRKFGYFTVCY